MKRLHRCLTCEPADAGAGGKFTLRHGLTRHKSRVCAWCRRRGVTVRREPDGGSVISVPIEINYRGRGA